jgi:hypothetical protein
MLIIAIKILQDLHRMKIMINKLRKKTSPKILIKYHYYKKQIEKN